MNNNEIVQKAQLLLQKLQAKIAANQTVAATQPIQPQSQPSNEVEHVELSAPIKQVPMEQNIARDNNVINKVFTTSSSEKTFEESRSSYNSTLSRRIKATKTDNGLQFIYQENTKTPVEKVEDLAIIQAFYGVNVERIQATIRALNIMLKSDPLPSEYVFVEAQTKKSNAVFSWLSNYGVKYIFKKITAESEGLFLKTALWNIGASNVKASRLCFIDSDVAFCNQGWLNAVSNAFQNYDILSLAGNVYYENSSKRQSIIESIGHKIMKSNETSFVGHIGFTIGMTREAYEMYGKFEAFSLSHDDVWIWQKIVGTENKKDLIGWSPYKTLDSMKYGLPVKVGSTEEICCHLNHGQDNEYRYKAYGYVTYFGTDYPFQEISYDLNNIDELPTWNTTIEAKTIQKCYKTISNMKIDAELPASEIGKIYVDSAIAEYGNISEDSPLIISTIFNKSFKYKDGQCVIDMYNNLLKHCQNDFTFVCFSNTPIDGIDTIPHNTGNTIDFIDQVKQNISRNDVVFPKNSNILFLKLDQLIDFDFTLFNCNNTDVKYISKYGLKDVIYIKYNKLNKTEHSLKNTGITKSTAKSKTKSKKIKQSK